MKNKGKIKVVAFFGCSSSGKDWAEKEITSSGKYGELTSPIISCTTRPPREGEVNGKDYFFVSDRVFCDAASNGEMLEITSFNNWWYGTPYASLSFDKVNVGVFNLHGLNCILQDERLEVYPVFMKVDDKTRLLRALERESNPNCKEICRRFLTDSEDFENIPFAFATVDNNGDKSQAWKQIDYIMSTILM